MKTINKILILVFHLANLMLIIFYLYPGSIFGHVLYGDSSIQPQITRDFVISSNHLYVFLVHSTLGIFAYQNKKENKFLIIYLFSLSIILELFHFFIPNRAFEWGDLFGNIIGVLLIVIIYNLKNKYA
jgi:hypothetical protein